jgi:non-specific serine/threonine protein kinase
VAAARGRWAEATRLLAGAVTLRETVGTQLEPDELAVHEHLLQTATMALGEERFTALWAGGRARPLGDRLATFATAIGSTAVAAPGEGPASDAEAPPPSTISVATAALSPPRPPTNLPPPRTTFVGRTADIATLRQALDPTGRTGTGLLTLTGVAGSGKTRLALAAAEAERDAYRDGVWLVELAALPASASPEPASVAAAALTALDLREQPGQDLLETVIAHLQGTRLLLVLDNCEHVGAACAAVVAPVLSACPDVQVLATSQRPLGMDEETVWQVGTLTLPDPLAGRPTDEALQVLGHSDAVRLFVERAQAVLPGFRLSAQNAAAVVTICRQLDGLPLAIELAAARLHVLPVEDLLARLDDRFRLLRRGSRPAADRHQTLQATLDWSHGLLEPAGQVLLRRLAVFAGGWELTAAEAVCAGGEVAEAGVLEVLDELLERSLVHVYDVEGTPRYGMLETVRLYGVQQLERNGETAVVRDRHLSWCVTLAEQAAPALQGPHQVVWLARLNREHDNLRAALQWALDRGHGALGVRLAAGLWQFWRSRSLLSEGRRWLAAVLALPAADDAAGLAVRAAALEGAAWLTEDEHAFAQASALFAQSGALRRALGQDERSTGLLINAAMEARAGGHYAQATTLLEESLTRHRALGNRESIKRGGLGLSLARLALVLAEQGEHARATALYEECLALHQELEDREGIGNALLGLGDVARDLGDTAGVRTYCQQTLALFRELGHTWVGFSLNNLALATYQDGDLALAAQQAEESVALFRGLQAEPSLAEVLVTLGRVRGAQGEEAAARADLSEALTLASAQGPRFVVTAAVDALGVLATQQGQVQHGVRLLAAAAQLHQEMGAPARPADRPALEGALAAARTALGEAAFTAAWAAGQTLPLEQVVAHALAAAVDEPLSAPEK